MSRLVSVIMPAFNAAGTLDAAARTVLGQAHTALELLIVDDASRDATREVADELARRDSRVRVIRQTTNGGVARARNAGLEAATGALVAFLDSDDQWLPDKLTTQLAGMTPDTAFSYMAYAHVDASGRPGRVIVPPETVTYGLALRGNPMGTLTVMIDADLLSRERFPLRGHEDYALWLTLLRRIPGARRVGEARPYALYRTQGASLSGSKWRAMRWQWAIYREQERLGLLSAAACLSAYAVKGIRKHVL